MAKASSVAARAGNAGSVCQNPLPSRRLSEHPALQLSLLVLLILAAYANTFGVPFVLDDQTSIVENPVIRDLSGFLSGGGFAYRPRRVLGYLSLALNYRAGGLEVAGYHAVNLAIHILCSLLVYRLARLLAASLRLSDGGSAGGLNPRLFPLLAALVFAVHPVQTEAVTYVVQRLASLATMFYLSAVVLYLSARLAQREPTGQRSLRSVLLLLASAGSAVAALLTKEVAATLPLALVLCEFSFFGATRKKLAVVLAPLALALVLLAAMLADPARLSRLDGLLRMETGVDRLSYLATQFTVIPRYLRLLFLPVGQNIDYDYPLKHGFTEPAVLAGLLLILGLLTLSLWLFRRGPADGGGSARVAAFGIAWFFLALSVESSVLPILDVIFEHRLYLPAVGFSLALSALICSLLGSRPQALGAAVAGLALCLAAATFARNAVWSDAVTLWSDAASKSPGKSRPHFNLAKALLLEGRVEDAWRESELAVRLAPDNPEARTNLAVVLEKKGLAAQALEHYRKAVELSPDYALARLNLGRALEGRGQLAEAAAQYREAVRLDAAGYEARNNLGGVLIKSGSLEEARRELLQAARLEPLRVEPVTNLGVCCEKQGELEKAIAYYREAIRLEPGHAAAHLNLGNAQARQGRLQEAIASYREAIRLKPEEPAGYLNLGLAYLKAGELLRAREQFAAVQQAAPGEPVSRALLARLGSAARP